jgi:hypothetical protein
VSNVEDHISRMENTQRTAETKKVRVFFYGSFINRDVLARAGYFPGSMEIARLEGFDITTRPLATLVCSEGACVYGILTTATHAELQRLYGEEWVNAYLPEAVVVTTGDGALHPALCYIATATTGGAPFENYLDRILEAAKTWAFPTSYIQRLERLRME